VNIVLIISKIRAIRLVPENYFLIKIENPNETIFL